MVDEDDLRYRIRYEGQDDVYIHYEKISSGSDIMFMELGTYLTR